MSAKAPAALDHFNRRFVGALLRYHLERDQIPHGFTVDSFRTALRDHQIIAGAGR